MDVFLVDGRATLVQLDTVNINNNMMHFFHPFAVLLILVVSLSIAVGQAQERNDDDTTKVVIRFYGEAQCPFCRRFVTEVWQPIWLDLEFRPYLDYDFIPWGNAYFATEACGSGPYSAQERACWYQHCIDETTDDDEKACFGSDTVVYQHGSKEGEMDIYESCVKKVLGLEFAVDFTYCAEGPNMDDTNMPTAKELMVKCATDVDPQVDLGSIQQCFDTQGRKLEIQNAKQTPTHPGVPYVLVDGTPIDDFTQTQQSICKLIEEKGAASLPKACKDEDEKRARNHLLRYPMPLLD